MPTQQTTYNSRVTDEALEKKFRDTFKSQGGAELVDDLYAQGVIVPIVDFTAAAQGSELRSDLQTAWDFATEYDSVSNGSATIINTPGFWQIGLTATVQDDATALFARILLTDGVTNKEIWEINHGAAAVTGVDSITTPTFVVFVRSGDSIRAQTNSGRAILDVWYRQIADVSGNLTNPLGFTSS